MVTVVQTNRFSGTPSVSRTNRFTGTVTGSCWTFMANTFAAKSLRLPLLRAWNEREGMTERFSGDPAVSATYRLT